MAGKPVVVPELGDDDGPLRPGFASEEIEPTTDAAPAPPLDPDFARATYAGIGEEEATEIWARETLCATCYHRDVCKLADGLDAALVVISRCRFYSPAG